MTIMSRILRLWKADLHGVMDQMEDRGLLLKQHLREMENSLFLKESRIQQVVVDKRHIKNDLTSRTEECEKLEKDMELALQKGKDNIAKLLIRKQVAQRHHCENLQQQYDALETEHKQIRQLLDEHRLQYEIFKVKATSFNLRHGRTQTCHRQYPSYEPAEVNNLDEHEIELELIRRKEQLKNGGGPV
ncbi:MAG: PspA/IM30 family protein [Desulforhopalus sp.]